MNTTTKRRLVLAPLFLLVSVLSFVVVRAIPADKRPAPRLSASFIVAHAQEPTMPDTDLSELVSACKAIIADAEAEEKAKKAQAETTTEKATEKETKGPETTAQEEPEEEDEEEYEEQQEPETTKRNRVSEEGEGYYPEELGIDQISTIDIPDDLKFDEYGVPLEYSYAISGNATAYASGYITSTGTGVYPGIVAVDPRIIPYGSALWIVADDGTVYGYGIAADTGGFIYWNNAPVADLYMWTESECNQWGVRSVTVYVLN